MIFVQQNIEIVPLCGAVNWRCQQADIGPGFFSSQVLPIDMATTTTTASTTTAAASTTATTTLIQLLCVLCSTVAICCGAWLQFGQDAAGSRSRSQSWSRCCAQPFQLDQLMLANRHVASSGEVNATQLLLLLLLLCCCCCCHSTCTFCVAAVNVIYTNINPPIGLKYNEKKAHEMGYQRLFQLLFKISIFCNQLKLL